MTGYIYEVKKVEDVKQPLTEELHTDKYRDCDKCDKISNYQVFLKDTNCGADGKLKLWLCEHHTLELVLMYSHLIPEVEITPWIWPDRQVIS